MTGAEVEYVFNRARVAAPIPAATVDDFLKRLVMRTLGLPAHRVTPVMDYLGLAGWAAAPKAATAQRYGMSVPGLSSPLRRLAREGRRTPVTLDHANEISRPSSDTGNARASSEEQLAKARGLYTDGFCRCAPLNGPGRVRRRDQRVSWGRTARSQLE